MYQGRIKRFEDDDAGYEEWVVANWAAFFIEREVSVRPVHARVTCGLGGGSTATNDLASHLCETDRRIISRDVIVEHINHTVTAAYEFNRDCEDLFSDGIHADRSGNVGCELEVIGEAPVMPERDRYA